MPALHELDPSHPLADDGARQTVWDDEYVVSGGRMGVLSAIHLMLRSGTSKDRGADAGMCLHALTRGDGYPGRVRTPPTHRYKVICL
jgi:hypothetical protein